MFHPSFHRQRGVAALAVTLFLFFAMTLASLFANRNLVFEQRLSINQVRAAQAREAAEAGLEWAQAMLNNPQRIGADCQPSGSGLAPNFRERHLHHDAQTGEQIPTTWAHAGQSAALQASCVRTDAAWACSCPDSGFPVLSAPSSNGPHPAFSIEFAPAAPAGLVRLIAKGCTQLGGACLPGSASVPDAVAGAEVLLGLAPGLAAAPAAPLTVKGSVNSGSAAIGLHNLHAASGGLTLHAGGAANAPAARVTTAAGGSPQASWVEFDAPLASLPADQFFAHFFGMDKRTWKEQPMVTRLSCDAHCAGTLAGTSGGHATHPRLWIDGDLPIEGPVTLGTVDRPVIIVATGAALLRGAVTLHGLLYAQSIEWNDVGGGTALVGGAAVSENSYQGNGAPDFFYDAAVLAALKDNTGSFARVPGSWRDF